MQEKTVTKTLLRTIFTVRVAGQTIKIEVETNDEGDEYVKQMQKIVDYTKVHN
jgi:hypothetical protein